MLNLSLSETTESFRLSFREWLAANPPPKESADTSLDNFIRKGRAWQAKLSRSSWVGVHWPLEYGGRGLTLVEEAVIQEELARAGSPQLLGLFGLTMAGPVLIKYGTDGQKKKFLSRILSARDIWCQGFSEPEAGSDLSALKTKGVPVNDPAKGSGYLVTGNKVWTSFAQVAEWCFLLCRTNSHPESRYEGFSYLLVDMKSPGITLKPLKQISGDSEFNEVFFDNVFVPSDCLVGQEGEGWKIAISTLMYERVILTFARQLQSEVLLKNLTAKSKSYTEYHKKILADEILALSAVRALSYEHLLEYADNRIPGPEGSLDKLGWTNSFQSLSKFAHAEAGKMNSPTRSRKKQAESFMSEEINPDARRYLYSRGRSIAAGTSEIQRNIIAERILGLDKSRR